MPLNQSLASDEHYNAGRTAQINGQRSDTNPHERRTFQHMRWRDGWIDQALLEIDQQEKS